MCCTWGCCCKKTKALGCQPVVKGHLAVDLHLQEHLRLLSCAVLAAPRPKHTIDAVVHSLEFVGIKALERVA